MGPRGTTAAVCSRRSRAALREVYGCPEGCCPVRNGASLLCTTTDACGYTFSSCGMAPTWSKWACVTAAVRTQAGVQAAGERARHG
jgi:hypothetical protein